jgi:hypothetical protein
VADRESGEKGPHLVALIAFVALVALVAILAGRRGGVASLVSLVSLVALVSLQPPIALKLVNSGSSSMQIASYQICWRPRCEYGL